MFFCRFQQFYQFSIYYVLSSFTIFLPVLNFITSSALLQSALLSFFAMLNLQDFLSNYFILHFSHFFIFSRSSRTFPIPVTVRNLLLFTVSWQFSPFCTH